MPTTGKPSRACYRCRQRRVKCDLGQPECQKCLRLGQPCPGYRSESELVFQNENLESYPDSASRDHRKANIAGSWVLPSRSVSSVMSKVESNILAQIALFDELIYNQEPPPRSLSESWDDHAIPLIISQFSAPLANGERFYGFMDFFPDMVAKAAPDSPLMLCCKAVAFIYFDNRFTTVSGGSPRTVAAYGKALAATNTTLSDRNLSLEDETLVCVWLLSVYETLRGATMSLNCPGRPPSWNMHVLGLTTLLQMRSRSEFLSGGGRRFLWMLIGVVETRSLAAGVECPKEILSWLEDHISDFVPEELDMHHSLVHGYHASVVCAKIRNIVDTGHIQQDQSILNIIKEARAIGQEAEVRLARDLLTRPLYLRQAHIHNFHRAVRIHVQYSILELLQSNVADDPKLTRQFRKKQHDLSISVVQNLTQDTLTTISYILGSSPDSPIPENQPEAERPRCWGDGLRFLWPLRVIGSRKVISAEQREVVEKTLQRLNTELCIRAAVVPYAIPKQMQLAMLAQLQTSARSKGCKTCKRRKVKCDEEKPLCQRCQASQLECEGYESPPGGIDLAQISAFDQGIIDRLEEPNPIP